MAEAELSLAGLVAGAGDRTLPRCVAEAMSRLPAEVGLARLARTARRALLVGVRREATAAAPPARGRMAVHGTLADDGSLLVASNRPPGC